MNNGRILNQFEFYNGLREWHSKAFTAEEGTAVDGPLIHRGQILRIVAKPNGGLQAQIWNVTQSRWEKGSAGSLQNAMRGRPANSEELQRAGIRDTEH